MANVIQSAVKDPSLVLDQFIKNLDVFIKQSVENINRMKKKHQDMGNAWKGDQYNQLTLILQQTIKDATRELVELEKIRGQLIGKSKEFKAALAHKIKL